MAYYKVLSQFKKTTVLSIEQDHGEILPAYITSLCDQISYCLRSIYTMKGRSHFQFHRLVFLNCLKTSGGKKYLLITLVKQSFSKTLML